MKQICTSRQNKYLQITNTHMETVKLTSGFCVHISHTGIYTKRNYYGNPIQIISIDCIIPSVLLYNV